MEPISVTKVDHIHPSGETVETAASKVSVARSFKSLWMALAAVGLLVIAWLSGVIPTADREKPAPVPRLANPVQVTSASGVEDFPAWSPDGRTLAYARTEAGSLTGGNWDIWVTTVGTGPPVNRTSDYAGRDCCPSWSPDGSEIVYRYWTQPTPTLICGNSNLISFRSTSCMRTMHSWYSINLPGWWCIRHRDTGTTLS